MVDDSFGFNTAIDENLNEQPVYTGSYELALIKSGKGFEDATVFIEGNNAALAVYNKEHNKNYAAIPAELYSFSSNSVEFKADEVVKKVTVTWDVKKVAEYMDKGAADEYVIPVGLKSYDLEVNEGRDLVILNLKKTNVTHEQKLLSWTLVYGENAAAVKESKNISVLLDKAPGMDLTLDFTADTDAIAAYNQANGTNYTLAPEGLISFEKSLTLANGELIKQLAVNLDASVLIGEDGTMPEFEGYVVPVRVSGTSVEGIVYENALTYVAIKGMAPVPPQLFERVWGLYSASSAEPWYGTLLERPGTGGPDRNIAMDDKYVYVSQSHESKAVIKAFDIKNPANVVDVNMTGVEGGTHVISCVRVIPRANGDGVLVASNLGSDVTVKLYAWTNGIDQKPEVLQLTNTWRRLGDKFTFRGTWDDGELWFMEWKATRSTVIRFPVKDGKIATWEEPAGSGTWSPAGRWFIPFDQSVNMIGAMYAHPEAELVEVKGNGLSVKNALITTTSGGWFWNITDTFVDMKIDCAVDPWTTDPGLALTFGYTFFKVGERNYIAYTKLEGEFATKANLIVLNDPTGTAAGFKAALEAQDVAFSAPLQDAMDATVDSPITAENSVGDCCSYVIDGTVYIAALQQGGGLSLFKYCEL